MEIIAPKKAFLPTFLGKTPNLLGEKLKTRTDNLHHLKAGYRCGHFEPKGGGPT